MKQDRESRERDYSLPPLQLMTVSVAADTSAPELLGQRYRLGALLGRGSTATVYSAVDLRFHRYVIVKLFSPAIASDPALCARFSQQVTRAARIKHPHVAAILDAGFVDDRSGRERPFVVSEPAGPASLRDLLDRRRRLTPDQAVELARQLASALSYAHSLGIVHADVKPENVIVSESGDQAKLVDFSLSFVSAATGAITRETLARRAAYLAPEQVRGEAVSPSTDVYELGVLLYEMVVGRPPFIGDTPMATAERRVREHARPAGMFEPSIPPALEAVVSRALERAPEKRWPSMERFDVALGDLSSRLLKPVSADKLPRPVTPLAKMRPARRGAWAAFGLSVPVAAAVVACVLALTFLVPLLKGVPTLVGATRKADVPEVTGMLVADARALALKRGLELTVVGDRPTDRMPKGQIVQQAPVAGWRTDDRQPIRVTVSAGVSVPDVRGRSLDNAQAQLTQLGWRVARVGTGSYPGHPAGTVVLQYPAPGELFAEPGELALAVAQ